jgi:hypothetical protein
LRESEPSKEDAQEWGDHVGHLLEAALGDDYWVGRVLKDDPDFRSAIFDSSTEQQWMESRLNRLQDLSRWVEALDSIPFRSGFDPHKWADWKSPPQGASASPDDLRVLERPRGENGKLETENQKLRQYESRWLLKLALKEARAEGVRLKNSDPSERTNVELWARRICEMLKEALPLYGDLLEGRKRRASKRHSGDREAETMSMLTKRRF